MNPKQRKRYRDKVREASALALKARAERPSPMKSLDALSSGVRRSFLGCGGRLDSDTLQARTHTQGFREPNNIKGSEGKSQQYGRYEYGRVTYHPDHFTDEMPSKTGTLLVTTGERILEKRPISTDKRHSVDPDVIKRWDNRQRG